VHVRIAHAKSRVIDFDAPKIACKAQIRSRDRRSTRTCNIETRLCIASAKPRCIHEWHDERFRRFGSNARIACLRHEVLCNTTGSARIATSDEGDHQQSSRKRRALRRETPNDLVDALPEEREDARFAAFDERLSRDRPSNGPSDEKRDLESRLCQRAREWNRDPRRHGRVEDPWKDADRACKKGNDEHSKRP
jgi:hypothetical protein